MATAIERPYDVGVFNTIPSLGDANEHFLAHDGPEIILSSIWDLFFKYKLTEQYGPVLIHRHWPVNANEVVVDVNGTSTAWALEGSEQSRILPMKKYGRLIRPCSWIILNGQLMPYEFYLDDGSEHDEPTPIDPTFVEELTSILEGNELLNVLGFRLIRNPGQKVLEVTEGDANVTFPITENDHDLFEKDMIQAGWQFPSTEPPQYGSTSSGKMDDRRSFWAQGCKSVCTNYCRKPDPKGSHMKVHLGGHDKSHQTGLASTIALR